MDRPAADDAQHAQGDGEAHGERHGVPEPARIAAHGVGIPPDHAAFGGHLGRFTGHRDERRFGHRGAEPQGEGEGQQPEEASLAGEGVGHGAADGEEPQLQPLDEEGEPDHHEKGAHEHVGQVGQRLADHHQLKKGDHQQDGRQIFQAAEERFDERGRVAAVHRPKG